MRAPAVAPGVKARSAGSRGKPRPEPSPRSKATAFRRRRRANKRRRVMNRLLLMLRVTGKDGERGPSTRTGGFERVLEPGRHRLLDPKRELAAELFQVVRAEFPTDRYAVLKAARPDLVAELFEAVETGAGESAIVKLDGRPGIVLGRG